MDAVEAVNLFDKIMDKLQDDWMRNCATFKKYRVRNDKDIRSSQIAALVSFLIDAGVITEDHLGEYK